MIFLEKILIEHYTIIIVFIVFTICTYKFLIKRLQLQNENTKRVYLEKSKIHIEK
jgi:hypothetical protein